MHRVAGDVHAGLAETREDGRRGSARRAAERAGRGPHRCQGRAHQSSERCRAAGGRSHQLRLAQVGAADGRRGASHGAHPAQARRELPGAGAEHEGPGGRAGGRRRGDRGVRRRHRVLLQAQHQLLDRRVVRALRARLQGGAGRGRQGARLHLGGAGLSVRRRGGAAGGGGRGPAPVGHGLLRDLPRRHDRRGYARARPSA